MIYEIIIINIINIIYICLTTISNDTRETMLFFNEIKSKPYEKLVKNTIKDAILNLISLSDMVNGLS